MSVIDEGDDDSPYSSASCTHFICYPNEIHAVVAVCACKCMSFGMYVCANILCISRARDGLLPYTVFLSFVAFLLFSIFDIFAFSCLFRSLYFLLFALPRSVFVYFYVVLFCVRRRRRYLSLYLCSSPCEHSHTRYEYKLSRTRSNEFT